MLASLALKVTRLPETARCSASWVGSHFTRNPRVLWSFSSRSSQLFLFSRQNRNHERHQQDRGQQPIPLKAFRARDQHCWRSLRSRDQHLRLEGSSPTSSNRLRKRGKQLSFWIHSPKHSRCRRTKNNASTNSILNPKSKSTTRSDVGRHYNTYIQFGDISYNTWESFSWIYELQCVFWHVGWTLQAGCWNRNWTGCGPLFYFCESWRLKHGDRMLTAITL